MDDLNYQQVNYNNTLLNIHFLFYKRSDAASINIVYSSNLVLVFASNEPTHILCGVQNYVITKNNISLEYIEAKDLR